MNTPVHGLCARAIYYYNDDKGRVKHRYNTLRSIYDESVRALQETSNVKS